MSSLIAFQRIRDYVREAASIELDESKQYLLDTRLSDVKHRFGFDSLDALAHRLLDRAQVDLRRSVVEALTTNETSFFRDPDVFAAVESLLSEQVQLPPKRPYRVWSAACSTGQEAYSVAMVFKKLFPTAPAGSLEITATDLNTHMVERTREGAYTQIEINRGLPAKLLVQNFQSEGLKWRVKSDLRAMVQARGLNLADSYATLPMFDVVLLRNVLIYFSHATRASILDRVADLLQPSGVLFLGKAESVHGLTQRYEQFSLGQVIAYKKK